MRTYLKRLHRLLSVSAVTAMVAALVVFAQPVPKEAFAAGNGQWSIAPTAVNVPPGPGVGQAIRQFFDLLLVAGTTYQDSVTITNYTNNVQQFVVRPADAFNAAGGGGFSLKNENQPNTDIGNWIQLDYSKVTLQPRSMMEMPFWIRVPQDATAGDHIGGIVLEPVVGTSSTSRGLHLTIVNSVGVRIYGRVRGQLRPSLAVTRMSVHPSTTFLSLIGGPTGTSVTFSVTNTGNERLTPTATVRLKTLFGSSSVTRTVRVPELIPNNSATFTVNFPTMEPYVMETADVSVSSTAASGSGSAQGWAIPWILIVIVIGVIVYLVRRRRHREPATGDETTPTPDTPAPRSVPTGV